VTRPSPADLEAALACENWGYLWRAALPIARAALRRAGVLDPDSEQEAYLTVGVAVRRWQPWQGAFTTYVSCVAVQAARGQQRRAARRGFTGEGRPPATLHMDWAIRQHDDGTAMTMHEIISYPFDATPEALLPGDRALDRVQTNQRLNCALAALTDDERGLLRLLYAAGLTQAEVGQQWGVGQTTVLRRASKVLDQIRERVK